MSDPMQNDPRLLVHAYVDGELDPPMRWSWNGMLARDPALAAERERIDALRQSSRSGCRPLPVPLALARRSMRPSDQAARRRALLCAAVLACARPR